ncbi:flagellar motor protein [Methylacidiphilum sp. Yel]|uniref:OmpA family protein n=1 Tax=Methylacidiphilum sp. Yel TaxID=1847730 RepID=UPI00106A3339|nr:OmpA family protein [Methylacidiphilum sp. Yel]TFE69837.1 flagellar motor protein [Methylacidiphilum sp. Yel]
MDQKPAVVPVKVQKKKQTVLPAGGLGAVFFWVSLSVFLGATAVYFYSQYISLEKTIRVLKEEDELLKQENQKQRAVVDQLQAELSQTGSLLKSQEELLEKTTQSLKAVESKKMEEATSGSTKENSSLTKELENRLKAAFPEEIQKGELTVMLQKNGVVARFAKSALFAYGGIKLSTQGKILLSKFLSVTKPFLVNTQDSKIEVCSFTDNDPPAHEVQDIYPTNWEISAIRSAAVIRALIQIGQLPEGMFSLAAGGETNPIADNSMLEGKEKNRRVEITVYPASPNADFRATANPSLINLEKTKQLQPHH